MVGSSQWRCRPTSISRPPSTRASRRNRIWSGTAARLGRRLGQRLQHGLPGRERRQDAAVERAAGRLDAVARRGVHVVRLLVQAGEQPFAQRGDRLGDAGQRAGESLRRLGDAGAEREDVAFQRAPGASRRRRGAGVHLMADQPQERLGRIRSAGIQAAQFRMILADAAGPARRRQRARRLQRGVQRRLQQRAGGDQFLDAPPQAAGARPPAFGAEQPAAHLGGFQPGEPGGERAVRRVEHVVAFVEHVAAGHDAVVQPAPGGLGHHQRMVGDDKLCGARAADRVLDEAAPPVRAGGVDALAAPVGEAQDGRGAEQLGQPAGQVAALDVAIVGHQRPARDQAERDDRGRRQPRRRRAERVLQVQQAEVVLAALAHHHAPVAVGRVGEQVRQFGVDLALQMAGEGADPHAAVVLLRPQAGGRQIAEGLAGAGAGLRQHQMRIAAGLARREGGRGGAGVVRLARPLLGVRSQHRGEPRPCLGFRHRSDEGGGSGAASSHSGRRFHTRNASLEGAASGRPSAAVTNGAQPHPAWPMRAASPAASRFSAMSRPWARRCSRAAASSGSSAAAASRPLRRLEVERQGEPARRRRGGARRQRKGEQLQQIECRHAAQAEAAERRRRMHQQRRREATQMGGGVRRGQQQQLAIGGEDRGAAVSGHDGRRVGQGNARHGYRGGAVTGRCLDADSPVAGNIRRRRPRIGEQRNSYPGRFVSMLTGHRMGDAPYEQSSGNTSSLRAAFWRSRPARRPMPTAPATQRHAGGRSRGEPGRRWRWRWRWRRILTRWRPSSARHFLRGSCVRRLCRRRHAGAAVRRACDGGGGNDGGGGMAAAVAVAPAACDGRTKCPAAIDRAPAGF